MKNSTDKGINLAKQLIDEFLARTGIGSNNGDSTRRYLWTDAFAVQSCFALSHILNEKDYHRHALNLIEQVHYNLGRHRPDDSRTGWISGLPEEEGKQHPTINGLRIGKKLPERSAGEPYDQQLEWERDGQYFHYLTRWFNALMQAFNETGEQKFALWAGELIMAGEKFTRNNNGKISMVWKMNIDLTKPLVESMGAHDPLEALICIYRAGNAVPGMQEELKPFKADIETICRNMNWFTYDSLGIGGLLLSTKRSLDLKQQNGELPSSIHPEYLFAAAIAGLKVYSEQIHNSQQPEAYRLAFRECGLALGVNALYWSKDDYQELLSRLHNLKDYSPLVSEITEFWSEPAHRSTPNWNAHQDINAVTLAASLLAEKYPKAF